MISHFPNEVIYGSIFYVVRKFLTYALTGLWRHRARMPPYQPNFLYFQAFGAAIEISKVNVCVNVNV